MATKGKERSFCTGKQIKNQSKTLLVSKENVSAVQHNLRRFKQLCLKASELHNTLLTQFSPPEEVQREQETWFQTKKSKNDEFVEEISTWLNENGISCGDDDNGDVHDGDVDKNAKSECQDNINPDDSVSNVLSK